MKSYGLRENGVQFPVPRDVTSPEGEFLTDEHKFLQDKGQLCPQLQTPESESTETERKR